MEDISLQVLNSYVKEEATTQRSSQNETPLVGKFAGNIYSGEFFEDSVYFDYLSAFWVGYSMSSYSYAPACLENFSLFMNSFHKWYLVSTRRRYYTEMWDLFFTVAGTNFNETWYRCYLF